jgi:PAT family beta-lactamase induction signal transducer AmpG
MSLTSEGRTGRFGAFLDAATVYLRPRVLVVLLLGFSAGLPLALSGETLRVWLADRGVDLGTIGLLTLAGLPYTIKFLWAPVVDALDVPWLTRRLGRRRGWLAASQLLLMAAIVFLGTRDPIAAPLIVGLGALIVAFASATQDIVIDAYRVESLPTDEQAAGMAGYVAAYRVGMLASGAGVIGLTAWLETLGLDKAAVWPIAYTVAAAMVAVGLAAVLLGREPPAKEGAAPDPG